MCRLKNNPCKLAITVCSFIFRITLGSSEFFCSSIASEAVAFPMCNNKTLNTTVTFVKNQSTAIYFNNNYSTMGTSSECSCDLMVDPSPDVVSVHYSRSPIRGCAIFSFMQNSSSECRTKTIQLNKTLSFVLFTTQTKSRTEHACFGIQIDPYVTDRLILVTCKPSNNDVPIENEEAVVSISSQLTARKLKENSSDSAMIFTFQTVIHSIEKTSSVITSSYGITSESTKTNFIAVAVGCAAGGACITVLVVLVIVFCRRQAPTYETAHRIEPSAEHIYAIPNQSYEEATSSRTVTVMNEATNYENL